MKYCLYVVCYLMKLDCWAPIEDTRKGTRNSASSCM